ncbi:ABC transporter permease [Sulfobacillus thermosulfidooxidans]|uniref:ABC transporter permease n=1 Tax=Sulfobacillus thermosulfidooxidans TaxID=28034 RepID=UPI00048ABC07|nr:ABC transporter permease [Sulfobacillus thermosulfidooxidans]
MANMLEEISEVDIGSTNVKHKGSRRLRRNGYLVAGGSIVAILVLASLCAPLITPINPNITELSAPLLPIGTPHHWLGTDSLGRDQWTRILYGGRTTLLSGVLASLISTGIGVVFGILAGYSGWFVDTIIMRFMDILMSFPFILLAILIVAFWGPSTFHALLAIAVANVPFFARIIRSEVLKVKELEFITASVAIGASQWRIIVRHVFPMLLPYIISTLFMNIGFMISQTSALSFLGFGTQPPTAEWGAMLAEAQTYLSVRPGVAIAPGIAIVVAVVGFNLLGLGLKKVLSPSAS